MSNPPLGMHYKDALKKLKGPLGKDYRLRESLINQVKLHEGDGAVNEIRKELNFTHKGSATFSLSGASNRQTGIGEGKKLGDGRYLYNSKTREFVKVLG